MIINLTGSIANTGIAGQGSSSGVTVPGGLIRANSAQNGRAQPYDPYTLSFIDSLSTLRGNHFLKFGGEFRAIRMQTDRLGGTTYSLTNVNAFMRTTRLRQFSSSATRARRASSTTARPARATSVQNYYIAYAQDEWHVNPKLTLELRRALRLLHADARGQQPDRRSSTSTPASSTRTQRRSSSPPRRTFSRASAPPSRPTMKTVFSHWLRPLRRSGSDRGPDSAGGRFRSRGHDVVERRSTPSTRRSRSRTSPTTRTTRAYQPRAFANDYTIPERIWRYTASVQRDIGSRTAMTAAYVGSPGAESVPEERVQPDHSGRHQRESGQRRDRRPAVFNRAARRGRQHHRRAEPVRGDRLQDQRRIATTTTRCSWACRDVANG